MAIIYLASFPNGKKYVGFTNKSLQKRRKEHENDAKRGSTYMFHSAIRKYGTENVIWEVLCEGEPDFLLNIEEPRYILEEQSHYSNHGYNMTLGGERGPTDIWERMSEEKREECIQKTLMNLEKTWHSPIRINAVKHAWEQDDGTRRKCSSEAAKQRWANSEFKQEVSKKISESKKEEWKSGVYNPSIMSKMTDCAKKIVVESNWYNDGVRSYRLLPTDARISCLQKGRLPWKRDKKK